MKKKREYSGKEAELCDWTEQYVASSSMVKEALKRHEESYPVELEGHGSPFYSLVSLSLQVVTDVSLSMKKETFNL